MELRDLTIVRKLRRQTDCNKMAYLNLLVKKLKIGPLGSGHKMPQKYEIVSLALFIMLVNIFTCLTTTTVEIPTMPANNIQDPVQLSHQLNQQDLDHHYDHEFASHGNQVDSSRIVRPFQSLPLVMADSASDNQSKVNDTLLDRSVLSHSEAELDIRHGDVATKRTNMETPTTKITTSSTMASILPDNPITATTPISIDEDYAQHNSLLANLNDNTTAPSIESNQDETIANKTEIKSNSEYHKHITSTNDTLQAFETKTTPTSHRKKTPESDESILIPPIVTTLIPHIEITQQNNLGVTTPINKIENSMKPPEQPIRDTIIPRTRLVDLLDIVKHLNLINNNSNEAMSHDPLNGVFKLRSDQVNTRSPQQPASLSSMQSNWVTNRQFIRPFGFYDDSRQIQPNKHFEMTTLESSPSNVEAFISSNKSSYNNNRVTRLMNQAKGDKTTAARNSRESAKGPIRYSLVSPYTANFDLDLQFNNLPIKRITPLKDQIVEASSSTDKPMPSHGTTKKALHEKQKLNSITKTNNSTIKHLNQSGSIIYYSADDGVKIVDATKSAKTKTDSGKEAKTKPTKTSQTDTTNKSNEENSSFKRGERHVIDKNAHESRKVYKGTTNNNDESENLMIKSNNVKVKNFNNNNNDNNKHKTNLDVDDGTTTTELQFEPYVSQLSGKIGQYQETSHNVLSHLEDVHKKSLYYVPEPAGLYADNAMPRPLTIGELARQHGVPFRLKSPLGEDYKIAPSLYDDHGLPSESGHYEDYVYLPYNNRDHQSLAQDNSLKLDEDLQQKIAIKAIEAISKDSEFSNSLLGSFYNDDKQQPIATAHNPSLDLRQIPNPVLDHQISPALQKLYANLLSASSRNTFHQQAIDSMIMHQQQSPPSSMAARNPLAMVLPLATISPNYNQKTNATGRPVNLMLTDLADRWALSRMPDLIPIPLAATVPGYLIRLPNGKILAAALTNSFSIQGIQRGPLSSNYKNFLAQKSRSLIKPTSNHKQLLSHNLAAGSGRQPIVLAPPQTFGAIRGQTNSIVQKEKIGGGLFSRGVLSQLGFGRSSQRPLNGSTNQVINTNSIANTIGQLNKIRNINKQQIIKLTNSPFPAPSFSDQELAALPIADLDEPVFSFADESQLLEPQSEYQLAAAHHSMINRATKSPLSASMQHASLMNHLPDPQPIPPNDLLQSASSALALRTKLNQLLNLRGSPVGDDLFHGTKKRRSPASSSLLTKLEPTFAWFAKGARKLRNSGTTCNQDMQRPSSTG